MNTSMCRHFSVSRQIGRQTWLFDEIQVFPGSHSGDRLFNAFLLHLCGLLPALGSSVGGPSCPLQPQQEGGGGTRYGEE